MSSSNEQSADPMELVPIDRPVGAFILSESLLLDTITVFLNFSSHVLIQYARFIALLRALNRGFKDLLQPYFFARLTPGQIEVANWAVQLVMCKRFGDDHLAEEFEQKIGKRLWPGTVAMSWYVGLRLNSWGVKLALATGGNNTRWLSERQKFQRFFDAEFGVDVASANIALISNQDAHARIEFRNCPVISQSKFVSMLPNAIKICPVFCRARSDPLQQEHAHFEVRAYKVSQQNFETFMDLLREKESPNYSVKIQGSFSSEFGELYNLNDTMHIAVYPGRHKSVTEWLKRARLSIRDGGRVSIISQDLGRDFKSIKELFNVVKFGELRVIAYALPGFSPSKNSRFSYKTHIQQRDEKEFLVKGRRLDVKSVSFEYRFTHFFEDAKLSPQSASVYPNSRAFALGETCVKGNLSALLKKGNHTARLQVIRQVGFKTGYFTANGVLLHEKREVRTGRYNFYFQFLIMTGVEWKNRKQAKLGQPGRTVAMWNYVGHDCSEEAQPQAPPHRDRSPVRARQVVDLTGDDE